MTAMDKFSEASWETGSSFRKARYNLDSCASGIADTTGESMNARFRLTTTVTTSGTKLLPPTLEQLCCWDKRGRWSSCVVGISPVAGAVVSLG